MRSDDFTAAVRRYLEDPPEGTLAPDAKPESASFLARGEYGLNYRVRGGSTQDPVARLVTGTQGRRALRFCEGPSG